MASGLPPRLSGSGGYQADGRWDVWTQAAAELGGRLNVGSSFGGRFGSSVATLTATLGGIAVEITGTSVPYSLGGAGRTEIRAKTPRNHHLTLTLVPPKPSVLSRLFERGVGAEPAPGNNLESPDLAYARAWVDDDALGRPLDLTRAYEYSLDGTAAIARRRGFEQHVPVLVVAAHSVVALATGATRLEDRWRTLAGELGATYRDIAWPSHTTLVCSFFGTPIQVQAAFAALDKRSRARRLYTRVWTERRDGAPDSFYMYDSRGDRPARPTGASRRRVRIDGSALRAWTAAPDRMAARLTQPVLAALKRAAPAAIIADPTTIEAYLPGFAADPDRVRAAMAAIRPLADDDAAATRGSPYR